jgi:hypothetical protein
MDEFDYKNIRVIYPTDNGGVSICIPTHECVSIAKLTEHIPAEKSYQVIDRLDIPTDATYRNAWTYEEN